MNNIRLTVLSIIVLAFSFGALATPAQADGSFSLNVQGTSTDPIQGKVVNVNGQNKPIVTVVPSFSGTFMGYDKIELLFNGILKPDSTWTNTSNASSFSPTSYGWNLCAGNDTSVNGTYLLTLKGVNAIGENTVASYEIKVVGTYTCTSGGGNENIELSILPAFSADNPKLVEVSLISDIPESELCTTYVVQLRLEGQTNSKGEFCQPSSPTIKTVVWNTSGTPKGTYNIYASGLNQGSGSNIRSAFASIEIKDDGSATPIGGDPIIDTGGGGVLGASSKSAPLKPIIFSVPDTSKLANKTGFDLAKELVKIVFEYLIWIVSFLAALAIIISGFMYALAFGDPAKAEKGKKNLQWAVYGIVVVVLSMVLLSIVSQVLRSAV